MDTLNKSHHCILLHNPEMLHKRRFVFQVTHIVFVGGVRVGSRGDVIKTVKYSITAASIYLSVCHAGFSKTGATYNFWYHFKLWANLFVKQINLIIIVDDNVVLF